MEAEKVLPKTFPKELREMVGSRSSGMSFENACARRKRLLEERREVVEISGAHIMDESTNFFERSFSLCEH